MHDIAFNARHISWNIFFDEKRSVSQMIDLVMTIKTHTESSESELSSGTFGHVKVLAKLPVLAINYLAIYMLAEFGEFKLGWRSGFGN